MQAPVHFDRAEVERRTRAMLASAFTARFSQARKLGLGTTSLALQQRMGDFFVAGAVVITELHGEGADPDKVAEALGCMIGSIIASFSANFDPDGLLADTVLAGIQGALEAHFFGEDASDAAGMRIPTVTLPGTRGGNA